MKAIVVKDDNFKTVGFEVTASGKRLFHWGISPESGLYFTKQVNEKDWMTEIFRLVELRATIDEQRNFTRNFFEVASGQHLLKKDQGVNLQKNEDRIRCNEEIMENIISNII